MSRIDKNEEFNKMVLDEITKSGLRRGFIADKMGMAVNSLRRKLIGERSWNDEDIERLEKILNKKLK